MAQRKRSDEQAASSLAHTNTVGVRISGAQQFVVVPPDRD